MPRVSPDGRIVAHISGLMSDFGSIGGDVWTVPITGGDPVNVTKGQPVTFTSLAWTRWGLRASTLQNDKMGAMAIELGRAPRALFAMPVSLAAGDGKIAWDATGTTLATIVQDFTHAPAIFAEATIAPRQLTHQNDAVAPAVGARSVQWTKRGIQRSGLAPFSADFDGEYESADDCVGTRRAVRCQLPSLCRKGRRQCGGGRGLFPILA